MSPSSFLLVDARKVVHGEDLIHHLLAVAKKFEENPKVQLSARPTASSSSVF